MNLPVYVTKTALNSLQEIECFQTHHVDAWRASTVVDNLLSDAVFYVAEDPNRYRFNSDLCDAGFPLRERIDGGYRILYHADRGGIYLLLFAPIHADMVSMLYRHQIIRNLDVNE